MKNADRYMYKWAVLVFSTLTCSLTWGLAYTIGVFYISWLEKFPESNSKVAVIGGINSGVACLFGPLYDVINTHIGYRKAGALGGICMAAGYIGSSFATNVFMLCFFYGGLMGFGFGLAFFGMSIAINNCFGEQRTLAEGMVTFGAGVGGFGYTMLSRYLIDIYDWRGALLILGAITLHLVLFAQLSFSPDDLHCVKLDWMSEGREDPTPKEDATLTSDGGQDGDDNASSLINSHGVDVRNASENITWIRRCLGLFKNPVFLLMVFAELFCWIGTYVPFVQLPERARLLGIDGTTVAWIASSSSLAMSAGRLAVPVTCSLFNIHPFYAYGFSNAVAGLLTALSPLFKTDIALLCYAIFYGFFNVSVPLIRASAALLLGPELFSVAYGWLIAINGVGLFIGPALAGFLCDITDTYDTSFYFAGACLMTSGALVTLRNKAEGYANKSL